MPARVVDGNSLWRSHKLKQMKRAHRAEYANLIPLAEANGVFDADTDRVWSDVYSFNRDDITPTMVGDILADMIRVGLLGVWKDGNKTWGYWIGTEKSGRLPPKSHWSRYKDLPPQPPEEFLQDNFVPDESREIQISPSRIGLDRYGLDRIGLEPAALKNDEGDEMKIKKEIEAVCIASGLKAGGYKDTWDQIAVLGVVHSVGAVVRDFEEWLSESTDERFLRGPVSAYLQVAPDRLSGNAGAVKASSRDPEVIELSRSIARASGGEITFLDKQKIRLSEALKEFTQEEIITGFKEWFGKQDVAKDGPFLAGKFAQQAADLAYNVREERIEKEIAAKKREAKVLELQEQAEADRTASEKARQEEDEAFDPLA